MKDTYRIYLNSESNDGGTRNDCVFNVRIPNIRDNYEKYELYVDDFTIEMGGTTIDSILVNLNNSLQYNSYNSTTKGQNPTIATIFNPNQTGARTADLTLSYQNSNAPYILQALPEQMNIVITDIDGATLDLTTNSNFWVLNLRIDAHYTEN